VLSDDYELGRALDAPGDIDGDGVPDLAIGASPDAVNGPWTGAVWILFLARDGTVRSHTRISEGAGGFAGTLADHTRFGQSTAGLGDVDGDGIPDLAVGATGDRDGAGFNMGPGNDSGGYGAVWLLRMR
jgi:hypothetical protein